MMGLSRLHSSAQGSLFARIVVLCRPAVHFACLDDGGDDGDDDDDDRLAFDFSHPSMRSRWVQHLMEFVETGMVRTTNW
jgi:hypothetical protein